MIYSYICMISCDLITGENSKDLAAAIESLSNDYCHPMKNQWFLYINKAVEEIYKILGPKLINGDRILINELTVNREYLLDDSIRDWLYNHFM